MKKTNKKIIGSSSLFRVTPSGRKIEIDWITFSLLKASEGGRSKADVLDLLHSQGVNARSDGYSPYVGQYGIRVDVRHEKKASKILWSR